MSTPTEKVIQRARRSGGTVAANAVMALFVVYFLLPFWWLLVAATKDNDGLFGSDPLWFADMQLLRNMRLLFAQDDGVYLR
ncbi:ABC transporter permease family protein [Micromonospora craniellae]|uniref:Carbohydrate ABC transporter permease n=1 Tax=Micromonospora craniellae TaxID=2294034 RepID=A0A372FQ90_9ACTN|nr:hypothetical protein [Micromonospora craniellae]QOC92495.1 hypothetical protein ID554_01530 [Micromonospora craniellae]RFS39309.1 hypothetical protein D0Q02_30825 [Micromonospora craniellae]